MTDRPDHDDCDDRLRRAVAFTNGETLDPIDDDTDTDNEISYGGGGGYEALLADLELTPHDGVKDAPIEVVAAPAVDVVASGADVTVTAAATGDMAAGISEAPVEVDTPKPIRSVSVATVTNATTGDLDPSLAPGCFGMGSIYKPEAKECSSCPFASQCGPIATPRYLALVPVMEAKVEAENAEAADYMKDWRAKNPGADKTATERKRKQRADPVWAAAEREKDRERKRESRRSKKMSVT